VSPISDRAVSELELARAAVVRTDPARQRRDERGAQRRDGLIVLQRGEHQRGAIGQRVAQLEVVADVRALAGVRVGQAALVLVVLKRQRVVSGALRVEHRDPELADRTRLTELVVVLVERAVRRREHRLPGLRRLKRAEIHRAAQRAGGRAEAHTSTGEQVGVDRTQVDRRARRTERDPVERDRGLRLVVTAQRDRLRRVGIVRALRDVDAADRAEGVEQRVRDAAHRAVLIDVRRRHRHARAHGADDLQTAGVGVRARVGRRPSRRRLRRRGRERREVDVHVDLLLAEHLELGRRDAGVAALPDAHAVQAARNVGVLDDPALVGQRAGHRRTDQEHARVGERGRTVGSVHGDLNDPGRVRALRGGRFERAGGHGKSER
jgi:hypothetical protein